jgi:pyruvate formate lyase activating enzyme
VTRTFLAPDTVGTEYWHVLEDGRIQCDLCPRECKLPQGGRGLCFVRARMRDEIVLTTYGRSSGFCIDPIEKKPLNHFLPGTSTLSFGTAGCNLACRFCQNWDISKARETDILSDRADPDTVAEVAGRMGCRSVAFTYNDPIVFLEYAVDVARACRDRGIATVAVTAGYVHPLPRQQFFSEMDATNIDLKSFDEAFYRRVCAGHLRPVLETLEYVRWETTTWLEITSLLIPGLNDSDTEIDAMTRWIHEHLGSDVPLHFSAFHPAFKLMDRPSTPPSTLTRARRLAVANGLRYVYTGNVTDPEGQSTFCHGCGSVLIGRDWYDITSWNLTGNGTCPNCGAGCVGVFESQPGTWGNRRLPVDIHRGSDQTPDTNANAP